MNLNMPTVRVNSRDQTMGLGPSIKFNPVRGESMGARKGPWPNFYGPKLTLKAI